MSDGGRLKTDENTTGSLSGSGADGSCKWGSESISHRLGVN